MNEDIVFEVEMDEPIGWETNVTLYRNLDGEIIEIAVPDDTEGMIDNADND